MNVESHVVGEVGDAQFRRSLFGGFCTTPERRSANVMPEALSQMRPFFWISGRVWDSGV